MKNYYPLNININSAIRSEFDVNALLVDAPYIAKKHNGVWSYDQHELTTVFTQSWIDYMRSIRLDIEAVLLFYRQAYFVYPEPHIDFLHGTKQHSTVAINWVITKDDSEMVWYETPADAENRSRGLLLPGYTHEYISWPVTELTEVERHCIGNVPTIVRTDVPHNIIVNANPRWAINVRCKVPTTNWSDTVEYMREYIK